MKSAPAQTPSEARTTPVVDFGAERPLEAVMQDVAEGDAIWLSFGNAAVAEIALNWVAHVAKLGMIRSATIAANNGVVVNADGTYDFSNALDPVYGTLDSLGGWDIRPAPNAPEWELPQEEEVYRDVNSDGDPTHTVHDGYLSLIATHTRE